VRFVRRNIDLLCANCFDFSDDFSGFLGVAMVSEDDIKPFFSEILSGAFTKPMRVADLAEQASMLPSSFHHHFKQVTSMSPLQYQKQLRLLGNVLDV
jgi:AraC-like DNA-binding protein